MPSNPLLGILIGMLAIYVVLKYIVFKPISKRLERRNRRWKRRY